MSQIKEKNTLIVSKAVAEKMLCYHCGTPCITDKITIDDKVFCCEGCKLVYEIINENGLCDYYKLQNHPGLSQIKTIRNDKFAYLDEPAIAKKLYKFTDGNNTIITFYIPGVHCTSCMWLLEHLHRLNEGITDSRLNFTTKEVTITFKQEKISLRKIVSLLATIGYEPYLSLETTQSKKIKSFDKKRLYRLGVAGFCFGNIMMMSFPEYLGLHGESGNKYTFLFRYMNLLLALPVFFYSASEFFDNAWKGLQQKILNIDAPIAIAILITFIRSIIEITGNTGAGYLDSMTGIVFFMLVGRVVQERTYKSLSFHRDYRSYFPIAVSVLTENGIVNKELQDLKEKDIVQLHNDEIIPADSILMKGTGNIDYSFVTGESEPVTVSKGELVYAGGKQTGEKIDIEVIKPVASSYLTSLWNHHAFSKNKEEVNNSNSIVQLLSKYFTWILLILALITGIYWAVHDPSKIITSITSMLIIACPCALLLSATFTNANLLRIFSNNGLFIRDASVIEPLGKINHIVFDKTGTLTQHSNQLICNGHQLTEEEEDMLYNAVNCSKHPYSKAIANYLGKRPQLKITSFSEVAGKGIEATIENNKIQVGAAHFLNIPENETTNAASVYVKINGNITSFRFAPEFREAIPKMLAALKGRYSLSLLSGDNDNQKAALASLFGNDQLFFRQKPIDKLQYIERMQRQGKKVLMAGDGLNDAGALQQSDVGITLADDINNFTPSCDAILDAKRFSSFPRLLNLAKASRIIANTSFAVSIIYNVAGLYFAMQGSLKPIVAAVLMPCSTVTIVLIAWGLSSLIAKYYGLHLNTYTAEK